MSDKVTPKNIVDEMNNSFLDYAMSVIVSRALPDVRDGLKPVHRRILFAMNDLGNTADKPYKKSARIVGDVIGKYHPHGDTSVYDAMVRMAQNFSYRVPLVDGHGNFGSIDGDGAAAMRYTEARMAKVSMELLRDINKDTVDFQENYDGSELEPKVLPARTPNLLINGASGIAVGMATNIPPHNLGEVIEGTIATIDNPDITIEELNTIIKGPDFPLGANILGDSGIKKAYATGNGSIKVRSEYEIFYDKNEKPTVIISEIPFQVNKASMVERIAECVKEKKVEGITDLRDESDRDGIRVVIELSKNSTPEVVMNNLFKLTQLESSFAMNMLALVKGVPKILNLKEFLTYYIEHQVEVTQRKSKYELKRAQDRAHIVEGLKIALDNIDAVIKLIRASGTNEIAMNGLIEQFSLSEKQAKAILEMQFKRLTGLEYGKIESELKELLLQVEDLLDILANESRVNEIIKDDLTAMKLKYETPRRSKIIEGYYDSSIDYEELIEESNVIVTLTKSGYIKRLTPDNYKTQNRGGKGTKGMKVNEEDVVSNVLFTSTHADILFFTDTGKVFKTRVHKVPAYSRAAKGLPLVNLIDIAKDEKITKIITLKEYKEEEFFMFVTNNGVGKKTNTCEFDRINKNGKRAISLNEGDYVRSVLIGSPNQDIVITTNDGKALRCIESKFRPMGRTARGVKAISVSSDHRIIGADMVSEDDYIISISANGFGKASTIDKYRTVNRGGKGVRTMKVSEKTGEVVAALKITESELDVYDLLMITKLGQVIRIAASDIKVAGRDTQGVTLMRLSGNDKIANVELIEKGDDDESPED